MIVGFALLLGWGAISWARQDRVAGVGQGKVG